MPQPSVPRDYALAHLCRLETLWDAVHDGDIDAIHDARVATRRVRATLPFVSSAPTAVGDELRRVGRALGRVRELDATNALLKKLESRVPDAAVAIAVTRREIDHRLTRQRRRLVKKLLHRPRSIARAVTSGSHVPRLSSVWRSWRHELRDAIRLRATHAQSALDRATAVYMPNRAHSARIQIKKLRYLVELAAATGVLIDDALVRDLRRAQEALGDLHDMTVLGQMVHDVRFPGGLANDSGPLAAVISAEMARLNDRYARHRDQIRAACGACADGLRQEAPSTLRLSSAVLAIPVLAAWYLRRADNDRRPVPQRTTLARETGS